MTHPTMLLSALSEDAQQLYNSRISEEDMYSSLTSLKLDRDWLAPNAARLSTNAFRPELRLDPEFTPDARLLSAVEELVKAGYAAQSWGDTRSYSLVRIDSSVYTVAQGDGPWDIRISRVPAPRDNSHQGTLLAVLEGAYLETQNGPNELRLQVPVPRARDEEHDRATAASVTVFMPTFPTIYGRQLSFHGMAAAAHLYPLGTDPTLIDPRDKSVLLDAPVTCDHEQCQGVDDDGRDLTHVFAPYLPPQVNLKRALLSIEARIRTDREGAE